MTTTIYNSDIYGSTDMYSGNINVYANTEAGAALDEHCEVFLRSYDFNSSDDMLNNAPSYGTLIEV
jgi:hypothetical protein